MTFTRSLYTSPNLSDYRWVVLEPVNIVDLNEVRVYPNDDIKIHNWDSDMFLFPTELRAFMEILTEAQKGFDQLVKEIEDEGSR